MTDRKTRLDTLAIATLVGCCVLWGLNQAAAKVTLAAVPPLAQAAYRSAGAALLLAAYARWRGIGLAPGDGTWGPGLLVGLLFAAEFGCIFVGLQFTSASRMAVFLYCSPFVVALGMPWVTRGERLSAVQWAGLVLAFAGVAWGFSEGFAHSGGGRTLAGDALGLAAAVLWGATTLAIRATRLASAAPELTLLYQLVVSALLLGAASLAVGEHWPAPWALPAQPLALLGFQTVVVTFGSYLLWFWLVRHYPATRIAVFTLLTPLVGLWAGVVLLGEPLTARLVVACAAVVGGIALVNRPGRR